jgi:hypothetical protein
MEPFIIGRIAYISIITLAFDKLDRVDIAADLPYNCSYLLSTFYPSLKQSVYAGDEAL